MFESLNEGFEINYWYVVIGQYVLKHNNEDINFKDLPLKSKMELLFEKLQYSSLNINIHDAIVDAVEHRIGQDVRNYYVKEEIAGYLGQIKSWNCINESIDEVPLKYNYIIGKLNQLININSDIYNIIKLAEKSILIRLKIISFPNSQLSEKVIERNIILGQITDELKKYDYLEIKNIIYSIKYSKAEILNSLHLMKKKDILENIMSLKKLLINELPFLNYIISILNKEQNYRKDFFEYWKESFQKDLEKIFREHEIRLNDGFQLFIKHLLISLRSKFLESELKNLSYLFEKSAFELSSLLEKKFINFFEQENDGLSGYFGASEIILDQYSRKKQNELHNLLQGCYETYLNSFVEEYFTKIFYEEEVEKMKEIERSETTINWLLDNRHYLIIGKNYFHSFKKKLYNLICHDTYPKDWVNACISGEIRNTIVGIVGAITAKYNTFLGVAVPIAALIANQGVIKFCKSNPG